ncbi:hypothetical protein SD70_03895 [Gordoniibacillus kamchatkensis]|uniref:Uncharacterized protein n=1 Tax=Gordoniibacillus kamchatkensis TaxID=1590651 RepID=A0ABR5ALV9_9BACL|nr:hypothetical protein [Paenibacillus sp. VKM B-2647]KIL42004.1 hypothetical protein SD70_03895 [Paenibacillus sp. VKM B-2647]
MLQYLDFGHFFHRLPIPIGKHDKNELEAIYPGKDGKPRDFTYWLIALMWSEEEVSGWKVIVFPVAEGRAFWAVPPLFHTDAPSSFDKAWKLSETLRAYSRGDQLTQKFVNPYWDDWAAV